MPAFAMLTLYFVSKAFARVRHPAKPFKTKMPSFVGRAFIGLRRGRDSNPRYAFTYTHFPGVLLQPLGHLSYYSPLGFPSRVDRNGRKRKFPAKRATKKSIIHTLCKPNPQLPQKLHINPKTQNLPGLFPRSHSVPHTAPVT